LMESPFFLLALAINSQSGVSLRTVYVPNLQSLSEVVLLKMMISS
jgi:hypothetical protein